MKLYSNNLKQIRLESGKTQKELATLLNISRSLYGRYETENLLMPSNYLIVVSNYLNVSIDYLFGFTSTKNYRTKIESTPKNAGANIKTFRKENKLTQDKLANLINTNRSVIANYERGRNYIATPFLYTISKKYQISADYLLGKLENPKYLTNNPKEKLPS